MRAVAVNTSRSESATFEIDEVPRPRLARGEALVEVVSVGLGAYEMGFLQLDDARAMARSTRTRRVNLGLEFAGIVRSENDRFQIGQRVMGGLSPDPRREGVGRVRLRR